MITALVLLLSVAVDDVVVDVVVAPVEPARAPLLTRRFAVVVGQNDGGRGRALLRHAERDARGFADVLLELGGVADDDVDVVGDAGVAGLESALSVLQARTREARAGGSRVEAIVYYSGHSDDVGLLLDGERYPYSFLQAALDGVDADVKVAILDSCASGSMIREKGGRHLPPFLIDESARVAGIAVLTSSSRDEIAQESDALGASFFTHALVSGLRGAADASADGRVTLHEAYRFAFDETLHRTEAASGGAQHPAYDMRLSGTGDLVLTDLRGVSAGLLLADDIDGRVMIRDAGGRLVVELHKQPGAPLLLGLAAATYSVRVVGKETVREGVIHLQDGVPTPLALSDLNDVAVEPARARGDTKEPDVAVVVPAPPAPVVPVAVDAVSLVAINVALFPPIESNAVIGRAENYFGLHFLAGRQARLTGLDLAIGGSLVDEDARGLMLAAVGNWVGRDLIGAQLGAVGNVVVGDATGLLAAGGVNVVGGGVRGLMLAGAVNVASAGGAMGQVAGGLNVGGAVNTGLFLAPLNVHTDVRGA